MRRYLVLSLLLLAVLLLAPLTQIGFAFPGDRVNSASASLPTAPGPNRAAAPRAIATGSNLIFLPFVDPAVRQADCTEQLQNTGFEADQAWVFPYTASRGGYTTVDQHSGSRSARLGLLPGMAALARANPGQRERSLTGKLAPDETGTYSSVYQDVDVPLTGDGATLTFWYKWTSEDPTNSNLGQALILLNDLGDHSVWNELIRIYATDGNWRQASFDVSHVRGHKISVAFEVYNRSTAATGRSWMFVDDVSLQVCTNNTTEPTATPTSTATPTVTPGPSPTETTVPAGCTEQLRNTGFEADEAWVFPVTASTGGYTTVDQHTGSRSARLGLLPGMAAIARSNPERRDRSLTGALAPDAAGSYSSVYQDVFVPNVSGQVTLTLWFKWTSEDPTNTDLGQALVLLNDLGDHSLWNELMRVTTTDGTWRQASFDVTHVQGHNISIGFEVFNRTNTPGSRAWMFVDDVTLDLCVTPAGPPAR